MPTIINESGLYSLILTSRKPEARQFKKWVTADVLPPIRKTGCYSGNDRSLLARLIGISCIDGVATRCVTASISGHFHTRSAAT